MKIDKKTVISLIAFSYLLIGFVVYSLDKQNKDLAERVKTLETTVVYQDQVYEALNKDINKEVSQFFDALTDVLYGSER